MYAKLENEFNFKGKLSNFVSVSDRDHDRYSLLNSDVNSFGT